MANIFKKAGKWFEKNVTSPIVSGVKQVGRDIDQAVIQPAVQGIKNPIGSATDRYKRDIAKPIQAAGKSIDEAVFRPIGEATGLTTVKTPDDAKPKVDPDRAAAMSTYGKQIQQQGQQFNPSQYGPGYFQPQQYNPQVSSNTRNMPGIYSPAQRVPQSAGAVATPALQNVGGQNPTQLNLTTGTGANTYRQQNALVDAMQQLQTPQNFAAGYDPNLRQTYIDMATLGLDQQKQAAMAQLKEQQMKSGNYGSSVGQKQMTDLAAQYDRQVTEAGKQADLMQMEAEREDRYRNLSAEQSRIGQMAGIAGQSAGLDLSTAGYTRDTMAMQNSAEMIKAQYARQGIQIDNDTAMQMAQFQSGQQQQQFGNQMTGYNAQQAAQMAGYESEWQRYLAQQEQNRYGDTAANQAQQFNIGQKDTADVRNYGVYQDYLKNLANYGSDQIDPQSKINYELWAQQEADRRARAAATIGAVGSAVGGMM
jgi:hypothetical protein